ncbi:MAG TPA: ribose-phosphate pyrophosphokinase [Opitutales bacterium]|nr:ribose-phosphate pyrophosphokinase [Opitutales bacterium]HOO92268.1 ribose-phosphate pyrophosphokinase [Opitutales bacterium]
MSDQELKIFAGSSNEPLAEKICKEIGIPLGKAFVNSFPDGETFVQIQENIRGADVFIIQSTSTPANHHLMELLIMIDAARRASAARITAVLPFYGYARQDRKDKSRVPITAKLVANLLVAAGANRVLTVDLHAQQIQGFFDIPVDVLFASPVIYEYLQKTKPEKLCVCSPDVGGMKLASIYADLFGCPIALIAKRRVSATTVESLNLVGDVQDYDVLLVDDMTETAGTIIAASEMLLANGAKSVRAAVSHGAVNEIGFKRLAKSQIKELITTDTIALDPRDLPIRVVSIAPMLAEAIKRIHYNTSVTSLFKIKGFNA